MTSAIRYRDDSPDLANDYRESLKYRAIIERISAATQVDEAIIWGIGSRESAWGRSLRPPGPTGTGDWAKRKGAMPPDGLGWGRGLMQIDYASHEFARTGDWRDPDANITYAVRNVLMWNVFYLKRNIPTLNDDDLMRAAIAAYNCGPGVVRKLILRGDDADKFTTRQNYSADVLARRNWFLDGGGWNRR